MAYHPGTTRLRPGYHDEGTSTAGRHEGSATTFHPPSGLYVPSETVGMDSYAPPEYAYPPRYPFRGSYEHEENAERSYSHPSAQEPFHHQQHRHQQHTSYEGRYESQRETAYGWTSYEERPVDLSQYHHSSLPSASAPRVAAAPLHHSHSAPQHSFPVLSSSAVHHTRPPTASYPPSSWEYTPRPVLHEVPDYYPPSAPLSAESYSHAQHAPTRPYYGESYSAPSPLPYASSQQPYASSPHPYSTHPAPSRRASSELYTHGWRPPQPSSLLPPPSSAYPPHTEATSTLRYAHYPTPPPPSARTAISPLPIRPASHPAAFVAADYGTEPQAAVAEATVATLQQASRERDAHRTAAPILAFNPAREPSATGKQIVESPFGVTYAVANSGQSKGKAKSAEVMATCWSCNLPRAKCIMRGSDLGGWTPRVQFQCLDCLPVEETHDTTSAAAASEARDERLAARAFEEFQQHPQQYHQSLTATSSHTSMSPPTMAPPQHEHDRITFRDTFSGAVDDIVRRRSIPGGGSDSGTRNSGDEDPHTNNNSGSGGAEDEASNPSSRLLLPPEETARGLSASFKRQAMCCDVCSRVVGAGSVESLTPDPAPSFTIEVICRTCLDRYRPCSDCGGGGGRLTPGRWRCKELFPANRRTCTLSHARNPPLSDIDYDVLRITEIDPTKLASLDERLRKIYYNVRMRMQARPEMLERGDGLATTFAQVEKLIVDGWTLLRPLLTVDVEATRGLRRYVALQTSTPHKRRAKPKPGAIPRPEPVIPKIDPVEREVSGFLLLEHQLATGAVHVAVTMPWAISGDAFDATTILLDETLKRLRIDLLRDNMIRADRHEPPLPDPTYLWGITPFKSDSRMTQSLTRRGFQFIEERLRDDPNLDMSIFPPHRTVHVPNEFMRSFRIFLRDVTDDDGNLSEQQQPAGDTSSSTHNGKRRSSGGDAAGKPPIKKRARHLKASKP
ncbi:hypothetical protein JCM10908_005135 [Rhodotorula pacifica]|uniref:uncharacterized protein n=1 Tax=Rhodotorula pacifica TaxID=1495444 RepID=UPI00317BED19